MLGDIILWLYKFIKEQTCVHDYSVMPTLRYDESDTYLRCEKCGRVKRA